MALTVEQARLRIDGILRGYRTTARAPARGIVPAAVTAGKLYEAWVVCRVLEDLHKKEGYSITLRESTKVVLKSAPGPINRAYPYFELSLTGRPNIELWTDVEFLALSTTSRGVSPPKACDYHELDIVAVPAGTSGRPRHHDVLLGIECKNTGYAKQLLRSILGVRRELSLLLHARETHFDRWPRSTVPASPASCLMAYSTDARVVNFQGPGDTFGIDFVHEPLP